MHGGLEFLQNKKITKGRIRLLFPIEYCEERGGINRNAIATDQ